jgi:hypothetical protein
MSADPGALLGCAEAEICPSAAASSADHRISANIRRRSSTRCKKASRCGAVIKCQMGGGAFEALFRCVIIAVGKCVMHQSPPAQLRGAIASSVSNPVTAQSLHRQY